MWPWRVWGPQREGKRMKKKILWTANNPKEDALLEVRPWPTCGKRAIELRKAQLELEQKKHNDVLQVLQQQQQQQQMQAFAMLFQQQQQQQQPQAELFLKLFEKLEKK